MAVIPVCNAVVFHRLPGLGLQGELYALFRHEENSTAYRKKVMMNVSGYVKPGQFLAVMG